MQLRDSYNGSNDPFEGDRIVRLRRIPAGARITSAKATIKPLPPFIETINFSASGDDAKWGAKRITAGSLWVEVDFHARRTLASVSGSNFVVGTGQSAVKAKLQVDLGGVYVEINGVGAIRTPSDPTFFELTPSGGTAPLPGLTVNKFKITNSSGSPSTANAPGITSVAVRIAPTNISLRFGQMPTFWTRVGEMTLPEISPDFTLALQAFLADAKAENGFYDVPLIVHSDSIARLQIDFEIEFTVEENALGQVGSLALPFDFSRRSKEQPPALQLAVPMGARLAPKCSLARVIGRFAETRIAFDPMEQVQTEARSPVGFVRSVSTAGKVLIAPGLAQAQPISFDREISALAIDLLLEARQTAQLRLDLREDLDGKPGPASLLPKPIDFEVRAPVGLEKTESAAERTKWVSVALPAEFKFKASVPPTPTRYWIVAQSIEGEALLSVAAAKDAPNLMEPIGMQRSTEDGLSWRETASPQIKGAVTAFFRLRHKPERFEMPIALQIGAGNEAVRVSLDQFAASGAVDFDLDFDAVNLGLEKHLTKRAPACVEAEHLKNGDFSEWMNDTAGAGAVNAVAVGSAKPSPPPLPFEWNPAGSVKRIPLDSKERVILPSEKAVLLGLTNPDPGKSEFVAVQSALSQTTPVFAGCTYDLSFLAIASDTEAVAEIFWLGGDCRSITKEPVRVPIKPYQISFTVGDPSTASFSIDRLSGFAGKFRKFTPLQPHRVRAIAPAGAEQAEVRFSVPDGVAAIIDDVSLKSTAETLANGDFQLTEQSLINNATVNQLLNWMLVSPAPQTPADRPRVTPPQDGVIKFDNTTRPIPFEISQTVAVKPDRPFTLNVLKRETTLSSQPPRVLPKVELRWLKEDGSETGSPVVLELDPANFGSLPSAGTSPLDAAQAEIHLIIPPETSQEIQSISLSFPTSTLIPVTFVAQAPGELTVVDWQIGYEAAPAVRPPIPPRGLCAATPPGLQPGETGDDGCFCACCHSRQPMTDTVTMRTASGTPAQVGRCATCGDRMISFSGKPVPGAPTLTTRGVVKSQPIFLATELATPVITPPAEPQLRAELPPITAIKGIAERRAEMLAAQGIDSLEDLAAAAPEQIIEALGILEVLAVKFIADAKELIEQNSFDGTALAH